MLKGSRFLIPRGWCTRVKYHFEENSKGGFGLFKHVRHPRYLAKVLAYFGFALIANFSGLYIYFLASLGLVYLIVVLEEKELRDRFGAKYQAYARKVPRFIPK